MSVVINNARKQLITIQKSELNYRLMILASRMQRTAAESARLTEQKASIKNNQMQKLIAEGVENITLDKVQNIASMTTELDTELTLLSLKDDDMDAEMKMIQTQLTALSAEEDNIDKVIDNSIKKEFGTFSGN